MFEWISNFIKGHYHLWYVPMIIGLYLILPLLRLWVKKENKKYVEYFTILSLIFNFLIPHIINLGINYSKTFETINEAVKNLNLQYVGGFTTYFILGWYLNTFEIKRKRVIYYLGLIGFIITVVGTYIFSISTGKVDLMYENLTLNIFLQSLSAFLFIKDKVERSTIKKQKIVSLISKNSLGIYAIHVMIIIIVETILKRINYNVALINIPITYILTFIISFVITTIFHKIPILKKVI